MFGKIISGIGKIAGKASSFLDGGLGGAITSGLGALYQQSSAKKAASRQMDFQQHMSNTAYQRAMEDMRLAGLNPILAYSQGGASTPTGASYNPPNLGESAVKGAQSAAALAQVRAQTLNDLQNNHNLKAQEHNTRINTQFLTQQERRLRLENDAWSVLPPEMRAVVMSGSGISSAAAAAGGAGRGAFNFLKRNNPFRAFENAVRSYKR